MSIGILDSKSSWQPATRPVGAPQDTGQPVRSARSTRILLVEDEPLTAEVFARSLERAGHIVEVARDGLQALHRLRERTPTAVVLDMSLPSLSGAEVVRQLRAAGHVDLPIVVVSGSSRHGTALHDADLHPGIWLVKPIKPRELVHVVQGLIGHG